MVDIKLMTYEESRLQYFIEQRDAAERRVKYWAARARRVGYLSHANEQASNAGDEWSFCNDVIHMLKARSNDGDLVSRSALLEQHGLKYATKHGNQTAELQALFYADAV